MEWQIGNMVSFGGMAWIIKATMKDKNTIHYTLQNADCPYRFITVCKAA